METIKKKKIEKGYLVQITAFNFFLHLYSVFKFLAIKLCKTLRMKILIGYCILYLFLDALFQSSIFCFLFVFLFIFLKSFALCDRPIDSHCC